MSNVLAREQLIAGVLAATDKLVQQAGSGDWQSAGKTVADRKALLEQLSKQGPKPGEHDFLRALREAAAESEVALHQMRQAQTSSNQDTASRAEPGRLCTKA